MFLRDHSPFILYDTLNVCYAVKDSDVLKLRDSCYFVHWCYRNILLTKTKLYTVSLRDIEKLHKHENLISTKLEPKLNIHHDFLTHRLKNHYTIYLWHCYENETHVTYNFTYHKLYKTHNKLQFPYIDMWTNDNSIHLWHIKWYTQTMTKWQNHHQPTWPCHNLTSWKLTL